MGEVVGVIVLFLGLFAVLILWGTGGHAETHNESESD
jgi:hypothetical protein